MGPIWQAQLGEIELGYAHWPQLGTQFIALLAPKLGPIRETRCLP